MLEEYCIERVLGEGAFGITYEATDTYLSRKVAIKEFYPQSIVTRRGDSSVVIRAAEHANLYHWSLQRFIGESQVLAAFKHPNIVRVMRYFHAHHTAYFVMDYEEGKSLGRYLRELGEPLAEEQIRSWFVPILEGLREVHRRKYLHLDIKPENLYIRADGTPLLLDFGSAKLEMATTAHNIASMLTPGYAPVEQYFGGAHQGPPSDLYAVGATLYRCISGKRPAESIQRLRELRTGQPDPLIQVTDLNLAGYSPTLLQTVNWMLELAPSKRPQAVDDVLGRLQSSVLEVEGSGFTRLHRTRTYKQRRHIHNHKIIFSGPVGAGKTTAISTLSDIPVLRTDHKATDMAHRRKGDTTVAMDYGVMQLSDCERLHLYGTPGQERFDFMWDILKKGGIGLILLFDNLRRDPFTDVDFFLRAFRDFIMETKVAIGITRMDLNPSPGVEEYYTYLASKDRPWQVPPPVLEVDARNRRDVSLLVQALLYTIDPGVEDYNV
jgi:serine/threonine protein kinase